MSKRRGNKSKRSNNYNKKLKQQQKRETKAYEKLNKHIEDDFEVNIINLDEVDIEDETEEKSGHSELTEEQQDRLDAINRSIDAKASRHYYIIQNIGVKKILNKLKDIYNKICDYIIHDSYGKIKTASVLVFVTALIVYANNAYMNENHTLENKESARTYINVNMYNDTNELHIVPSEISIKTQDGNYIGVAYINWISQYLDTKTESYTIADEEHKIDKKLYLSSLMLNDNIAYEEYKNSTDNGNKEFYLSTTKPSDIDTKGFRAITAAFSERATSMSIKAYTNSYKNTFLLMQETIGGGELTLKTLKHHVANLESNLYNSDKTDGIIINLSEYKELNLKKLLDLASVRYSSDNGILTVYDYENNKEYFYISAIDNENVGCDREDLVSTDSENIYLTYGFNKEDDANYLTFGVKTDNNLYVIKINPEMRGKVVEWFFNETGENIEELDIDNIQNVIYKGN